MFYRNPIRRKIFANPAAELEKLKQRIERISLVHPSVTLTLYDLSTNTKVKQNNRDRVVSLVIHRAYRFLPYQQVLQTKKVNSILSNFMQLFGSATASKIKQLTPDSNRRFKVSGFVSPLNSGHYSKDMQYFCKDLLSMKLF